MSAKKTIDHLVYSFTGLSSIQVGINAEVLYDLKQDGKSILVVECDGILTNCRFNHFHNVIACASCQTRKKFIYNQIGLNKSEVYNLIDYDLKPKIPYFKSTDDLINYQYNNINIGRGVASSLISQYRKFEINSESHNEIIQLEIIKSINVLKNIEVIFNEYNIKEVILFNGRFSEIHPLRLYCEANEISYKAIESGSKGKYEIFENNLPHSIDSRHNSMVALWNDGSQSKRQIGNDWYIKRRAGDPTYDFHTFKKQGAQNNRIKNLIDKSKKQNILILNSSEDEMKVIQEWEHNLYPNQNHAIKEIVTGFRHKEEIRFILRIHPNLEKVYNSQTKELAEMTFPNLEIIYAHEDIDTYELIEQADKLVVFGSSTGIEGTYMGKPVILYGKSFYLNLNVTYNPKTKEELFSLIKQDDLTPKSKHGCLIYGYYMATYGNRLEWFEPDNSKNPIFLGRRIPTFNIKSVYYLFRYLKAILLWNKLYKINFKSNLKISHILKYKFDSK